MPTLGAVLETALYVEDLPRATDFYARVLQLRLLEGTERFSVFDVGGRSILLLFRRGATLEPLQTPGGVIPPHHSAGPAHLAFAIATGDFDGWERWLVAHGIAIESRVSWHLGGRSLYFRDPDHHAVELATPGTWETY